MIILTGIAKRLFSLYCAVVMLIFSGAQGVDLNVDHSADRTNYPYVFVHGYFGYGDANEANDDFAYWGMRTGNQVKSFNESGFTASAADVDPIGSAWDRACELYAELTGTVVDYGKAHSEKFGHERYGKDYTGKALVDKWDSRNKINIISHSFGGPTCALFASVLEYGAEEEINATKDGTLSDFFKGGKGDYIYSITGIAGAFNGTTLCVVGEKAETLLGGEKRNGDNGLYDMHPDNAAKINETIKSVDSIYYFTVPCCSTVKLGKYCFVDFRIADLEYWLVSPILNHMNTVTDGGIVIDEKWQPNDGLVNTISEIGPFNAEFNYVEAKPSAELAQQGFDTGVYNVLETYSGSHMSIMGNIAFPNEDGTDYLVTVMQMVNAL